MVSKWYFRDTNAATGPTAKASTDTDSFPLVPADKNTPKDMTAAKGAAQVTVSGSYSTASTPLYAMWRLMVGPALAAQTLTGGQANFIIGVAMRESNAAMNLYFRAFVYVWRSGSGNVKTIIVPTSSTNGDDTAETGLVITATGAAGNYAIQLNDRIVAELWFDIRNTKATAYTATGYYDGTTDVVDNTATADAAGYFQSPQTLNLPGATINQSVSDGLTHGEALTRSMGVRRVLNESLSVADPLFSQKLSVVSRFVTDGATLADTLLRQRTLNRGLSDGFNIADSMNIQRSRNITLVDAYQLSEQLLFQRTLNRFLLEALTLGDPVATQLTAEAIAEWTLRRVLHLRSIP